MSGKPVSRLKNVYLQHSKDNTPLGNAMRDCGLENFTLEVIERCETQAQANDRERFWIKVLKCEVPNGYNRSNGGESHVHIEKQPQKVTAMNLGEVIREYRHHHRISMGDFAKASGLSKPYISMLEANKNSKGGKPIKPSAETLMKVSSAIGVTLDELLRKLGDEEIDIRQRNFTDEETKLVDGYRELNDESKRLIFGMIRQLNFRHMSADNHQVTAV